MLFSALLVYYLDAIKIQRNKVIHKVHIRKGVPFLLFIYFFNFFITLLCFFDWQEIHTKDLLVNRYWDINYRFRNSNIAEKKEVKGSIFYFVQMLLSLFKTYFQTVFFFLYI